MQKQVSQDLITALDLKQVQKIRKIVEDQSRTVLNQWAEVYVRSMVLGRKLAADTESYRYTKQGFTCASRS